MSATTQTPAAPEVTSPRSVCAGANDASWGRRGGRIAVIDGLRLVAALMVVAFHYTYRAPGQWGVPTRQLFPHVYHVTAYGRFGVELFFVISGFVICMSAWGRGLGAFFTSRATRLYPAYWFAVLVTGVLVKAYATPGEWPQRFSFNDLLANLTMVQGWVGTVSLDGVYWTLGRELQFYLLFAIVVWRGLTYRRVVMFCVLWTLAVLLVPATVQPTLVDRLISPSSAPFFIAGVAMYLMHRFRPNFLLWSIVGMSYVLAMFQVPPTMETIRSVGDPRLSIIPAFIIVTGIFVLMIIISLGWLTWVRGAWLTTAAALTYPLYLLHEEIGWLVIDELHHRVPKWPLVIGLTVAMLVAAWLVHRLVERPVARRLKRVLAGAIAETSADQHPQRTGY